MIQCPGIELQPVVADFFYSKEDFNLTTTDPCSPPSIIKNKKIIGSRDFVDHVGCQFFIFESHRQPIASPSRMPPQTRTLPKTGPNDASGVVWALGFF